MRVIQRQCYQIRQEPKGGLCYISDLHLLAAGLQETVGLFASLVIKCPTPHVGSYNVKASRAWRPSNF